MQLRFLYQANMIGDSIDIGKLEFRAEVLEREVQSIEIQKYMMKIRLEANAIHAVYITGIKLVHARLDLRNGLLESA